MKKKIAIEAIILGIFILVFACGILFIDDDSEPEQPVFLAPTAVLTKTVIPAHPINSSFSTSHSAYRLPDKIFLATS